MASRKRSSQILEKAQRRLCGVRAIDGNCDLGHGLTAQGYAQVIEALRSKVNAYNTSLSTADGLRCELEEAEKMLSKYSERMLLGVAIKYGKDSDEYEAAGGVRKSNRKRSVRKAAAVS